MSFDALSWAAKCNPGSAPRKLVLLALAECASREEDLAFPSVGAMAEFTCLNRKTIIAALDDLERGGFITDTGKRVGKTKQVKVYQLHLEMVPKVEQSQKRNGSVFSAKQSQKRDTEQVREPVRNNTRAKQPPKPEGVSDQVWSDFKQHRKAKRATITETAMARIRREADAAGWSLESALEEMIARGWQGLKADWLTAKTPANDSGSSFLSHVKGRARAP